MTMGTEIREVSLEPTRVRPGEEVTATIRYRIRDAEPVLRIEVSSGYTVVPPEVPVPRTRTETQVSFVVQRAEVGTAAGSEDLCVVTFHLGFGATMDANLWIED